MRTGPAEDRNGEDTLKATVTYLNNASGAPEILDFPVEDGIADPELETFTIARDGAAVVIDGDRSDTE